jgi:hypothetical protein
MKFFRSCFAFMLLVSGLAFGQVATLKRTADVCGPASQTHALACYSDHHRDASGSNVADRYSSVFGYSVDLPFGVRSGESEWRMPHDFGCKHPWFLFNTEVVASFGIVSNP